MLMPDGNHPGEGKIDGKRKRGDICRRRRLEMKLKRESGKEWL